MFPLVTVAALCSPFRRTSVKTKGIINLVAVNERIVVYSQLQVFRFL